MEKRISPKPPTEDAPQKKAAGVEKTSAKRAKRAKKAKRAKRAKKAWPFRVWRLARRPRLVGG